MAPYLTDLKNKNLLSPLNSLSRSFSLAQNQVQTSANFYKVPFSLGGNMSSTISGPLPEARQFEDSAQALSCC